MIGSLSANYTQTGSLKKGLLFLSFIPLFYLSYLLLNLAILGLLSLGQPKAARLVYFEFYETLRFFLVLGGLFILGKLLKKVRFPKDSQDLVGG